MYLYSVTIPQKLGKLELADYFYGRVLELPGRLEMGTEAIRFFEQPVHLALQTIQYGDDPGLAEGFTGVQLNVTPSSAVDQLKADFEQAGMKPPDPRQAGDIRLLSIRDSSGNHLMVLGRDERPDEPLMNEGVGSLSVFVTSLDRAKAFFVEALGLPIKDEPHAGMLVLGDQGTPLMLYQVEGDSPGTPLGRRTGIALAGADLTGPLAAVEVAGGAVVDRVEGPGANGASSVAAATVSDADGNTFVLFSEAHLAKLEPVVAEGDDG